MYTELTAELLGTVVETGRRRNNILTGRGVQVIINIGFPK